MGFLGVPWQAPVPDSRIGAAGASYFGTNLTPQTFRTNSVKYGGFLPEMDVDVFEHLKLVDCGDVEISNDHATTFDNTVQRVRETSSSPERCPSRLAATPVPRPTASSRVSDSKRVDRSRS
ncbi:MAG: hypothetical protein R2849_10620 [Thermomicrobiales bacterium]